MRGLTPICKVTPESLPHLLRMLRPLGVKWSNQIRIDAHTRPLDMSVTMPAYRCISLHTEKDTWGNPVLVIVPHFSFPGLAIKRWIHYTCKLFSLADFVRKVRKVKQYEIR